MTDPYDNDSAEELYIAARDLLREAQRLFCPACGAWGCREAGTFTGTDARGRYGARCDSHRGELVADQAEARGAEWLRKARVLAPLAAEACAAPIHDGWLRG
jgi:hypothetical protein